MKASRLLWLSAPIALAVSCVLPAFEVVDDEPSSGGAAGRSGGVGGMAGGSEAGAPNQGAEPGIGGQAGEGGTPKPPIVVNDDVYVVLQKNELSRIRSQGLLANDSGEGLTVTGLTFSPITLRDDYVPWFDVEPNGSFSFEPKPDFVGPFVATYEVTDRYGQTAEGRVTIFVQPRDVKVETLDDDVGGYCLSAPAADEVGAVIAGIGDIDGDGYDDFALGAPKASSDAGRIYVVRGARDRRGFALDGAPDDKESRYFVIDGVAGSELGAAIAGLGDVNGDGLDDFVAGAPKSGTESNGAFHFFYELAKKAARTDVATASSLSLLGKAFDVAGEALSGGYDFDGDGVPDPVVTTKAPSSDPTENWRGLYAVLNGAKLSSGAFSNGVAGSMFGPNPGDSVQQLVSSVGDVSDDGDNDLLIVTRSMIAIVRGPASAFPANLGDAFTEGEHGYSRSRNIDLGSVSIAGAGDINGDGVNDLAFCEGKQQCELFFGPIEDLIGATSITGFSGNTLRIALADLTGDGASEVIITDGWSVRVVFGDGIEPYSSTDIGELLEDGGFTVSPAPGDLFVSVASVGDVNGDGQQDFAFGVQSGPGADTKVCVVYGTPKAR